jgi:hypothetical protein
MSRTTLIRLIALPALVAGATFLPAAEPPRAAPAKADPGTAWRMSGPFTHENLTVYLIHGRDQIHAKNVLTLDEALQQKEAVVHETQNVNQLQVENLSSAHEVFIQAGDIVKGGQQDRTLAHDMIIPPKSGKVALDCFCVEAGRWTRRGGEAPASFSGSKDQLASNDLKRAVRGSGSGGGMGAGPPAAAGGGYGGQGQVWQNVAKDQEKLKRSVKAEVRAAESQSSLQLTLENKNVLRAVEGYVKALEPRGKADDDVIGYAVCINGQVNNADVYAAHALFAKLWPKLLKASAVEAVAAVQKGKKFEPPTADAVRTFLADAAKGKKADKEVTKRVVETRCENDKSCLFITRDAGKGGAALRHSYIKK